MRATRLAWLVLLPVLPACGTIHAPNEAVRGVDEAGLFPYGGWAIITVAEDDGGTARLEGELLAVGPENLWLLQPEGATEIDPRRVVSAEVTGYDSNPNQVSILAVVGTLSTVSNGFGLVLTGPLWLIVGITGSNAQAAASRVRVQDDNLTPLAPFARFPQGMPPDVDPRSLPPLGRQGSPRPAGSPQR